MAEQWIIPEAVQRAVRRIRGHFRALDAAAQEWNAAQPAAAPGEPQVRVGFVTKPDVLGPELRFWTLDDDQALEDFLFDDLLAGLLDDENVDWARLPAGYRPLLLVLEFERHCQFEGWTAIANEGWARMEEIIDAYRFVGLTDEARALSAVTAAYAAWGGDADDAFYATLDRAYRSVGHATPEIEDRLPLIFAFVRSHPELFGVRA